TVELQRTTGAHFGTVSREGRSPKRSEGNGALVGAHKIGISCPRKTPRLNHSRGDKIPILSGLVPPGSARVPRELPARRPPRCVSGSASRGRYIDLECSLGMDSVAAHVRRHDHGPSRTPLSTSPVLAPVMAWFGCGRKNSSMPVSRQQT